MIIDLATLSEAANNLSALSKAALEVREVALPAEAGDGGALAPGGSELRGVQQESLAAYATELLATHGELSRLAVRDACPFGDGIGAWINHLDELNVYARADIREGQVSDRSCLVRNDIDLETKDDHGNTNLDRMRLGRAALDPDGRPYELHHIGQHPLSPLAELTFAEHRGPVNMSVLHPRSESLIDRPAFGIERAAHWRARAAELGGTSL